MYMHCLRMDLDFHGRGLREFGERYRLNLSKGFDYSVIAKIFKTNQYMFSPWVRLDAIDRRYPAKLGVRAKEIVLEIYHKPTDLKPWAR